MGELVEAGADIEINPWPKHSVFRDNLRGLGSTRRFARVPKWGAAEADLDYRPMALEGLDGFTDKVKYIAKSYGLYIGIGAGAAVTLAIILRLLRKKR
jgi:hypothetical protein